MKLSYEAKRNLAILAAKVWVFAEPVLIFCAIYFGFCWLLPYWGYAENQRLIAFCIATFGTIVNLGEDIPRIRSALSYPFSRRVGPKD